MTLPKESVHKLAMAGHQLLYQAEKLEMFARTVKDLGRYLRYHEDLDEYAHVRRSGMMEDLSVLKRMLKEHVGRVGDVGQQLLAVTTVVETLPLD